MPFGKTENVAMYGGGDWSALVKVVPDCTPAQARRIAIADPSISFFFFCREGMVLNDPGSPQPRVFSANDAVFFGGAPWWGSAPQCDGYVKQGVTTVYACNMSKVDPDIAAVFTTAQGLNAVDVVCLFAANLCQTVPDNYCRLAPNVDVPQGGTLAIANGYYPDMMTANVKALQDAGIVVLLSFLNNWDQAGWSCFDPNTSAGQTDAQNCALQMQAIVGQYNLDGIDIDDEYAAKDATHYPASIAMVTTKMRSLMPAAVISKALWSDLGYFGQAYQGTTLEQNLTCGWEMTYGASAQQQLPPYAAAGMSKASLSKGYSASGGGYVSGDVEWLKENGYGGVMAYSFDEQGNQDMMGQMVDLWIGDGNWNEPK